MKLDKFSIDIEKIGNVEIYSYNSFIFGYRNTKHEDEMFFFPIVVNENLLKENKNLLDAYLDFIDIANCYNEREYDPIYDMCFKAYDKVYEDRNRYEVVDLLSLSFNTWISTDITITPNFSINTNYLVKDLLKEISSLDKRFDFEPVYYDETKTVTIFLFIDKYDCAEISIDLFGNWSISYLNTHNEEEKAIKEIVGILEHILGMLNKNLGKTKR